MVRRKLSEDLRIIGDDFRRRDIKAFEIQRGEDRYVAHCGYQAPPAVTPLVLEYRSSDIDELKRVQDPFRSDAAHGLDFSALPEVLHTIGAYLEQKKASLFRVSNNEGKVGDPVFRIEYATAERERATDERSTAALYDLGVRLYKQRAAGADKRLICRSAAFKDSMLSDPGEAAPGARADR